MTDAAPNPPEHAAADRRENRFSRLLGAGSLSNRSRRYAQYAACGALFAAVTAAVFTAMKPPADPAPKTVKAGSAVAVHPDYVQRQSYIEQAEAESRAAQKRLLRLEEEMATMHRTVESAVDSLSGELKAQSAALKSLDEAQKQAAQERARAAQDAEKPSFPAGRRAAAAPAGGIAVLDKAIEDAEHAPVDAAQSAGSPQPPRVSRLAIATMGAPKDRRTIPADPNALPRLAAPPYLQPDKPVAVNRAPGTTAATYLPPGAFMKATLLTGLYAVTGGADDPVPVLMKIEADATLPNSHRSGLRECHATGSAAGSLSSERVLIRLDRLACVSETGEMLDLRVQGYAVGPDGKVGVRGKVVSRSGQAIAAAMTTGLMEGFGRSLSLSSQTVSTSLSTGVQTRDYSRAWAAGLGEGFSNAVGRIADYYLKLANQILPVLEVEPGIQVSLVVSQGVMLSTKR